MCGCMFVCKHAGMHVSRYFSIVLCVCRHASLSCIHACMQKMCICKAVCMHACVYCVFMHVCMVLHPLPYSMCLPFVCVVEFFVCISPFVCKEVCIPLHIGSTCLANGPCTTWHACISCIPCAHSHAHTHCNQLCFDTQGTRSQHPLLSRKPWGTQDEAHGFVFPNPVIHSSTYPRRQSQQSISEQCQLLCQECSLRPLPSQHQAGSEQHCHWGQNIWMLYDNNHVCITNQITLIRYCPILFIGVTSAWSLDHKPVTISHFLNICYHDTGLWGSPHDPQGTTEGTRGQRQGCWAGKSAAIINILISFTL